MFSFAFRRKFVQLRTKQERNTYREIEKEEGERKKEGKKKKERKSKGEKEKES